MKITKRKVNTKRHTTGYLVGGKWRSRREAAQLAKAGRIDGVAAYRGEYGHYIQSLPSVSFVLEDLPYVVSA
jgi:hypothetical protein